MAEHKSLFVPEPASLFEVNDCQKTPNGYLPCALSDWSDHAHPHQHVQKTRRTNQPVAKAGTSIKKIEWKDIVLLVGAGTISPLFSSVVKEAKRISLVPFSMIRIRDDVIRIGDDVMKDKLCSRCIWICLDPKSAEDPNYSRFINKIVEAKRKDGGDEKQVRDFLTPKLILIDGLQIGDPRVPTNLQPFCAVGFSSKNQNSKSITEFIEGRYDQRTAHVMKMIQNVDQGRFFYVYLQARLASTDNPEYLRRVTVALKEAFDDASSYPRQLLMQLYKMVNVRVFEEHCRSAQGNKGEEVCIEIRPSSLESCLDFQVACSEGNFAEMIRNHVKISEHAFVGTINITVPNDQFEHLVHSFVPNMESHANFQEIIGDGDFKQLKKLVSKYSDSEGDHTAVPTLKGLATTLIYQRHLHNQTLTPYAFLKCMKMQGCPNMLEHIRCSNGYNAMHLVILAERSDFLKMLFYANMWGKLRQDTVEPLADANNAHVGYTPRRLAEALSYKSKGYDVLVEFEKYERMWCSMCPLTKASLMGSLEYVNKLVESYHDLIHRKDSNGSNCLLYACASGNTKLVQYLLGRHVARAIQNNDGESALHMAAMFGHTEILQILSQTKFDIMGKKNNKGMTAIDYCAMNGDIDVLELYVKKKFPINPKALTLASKNKQTKVAELLMNKEDARLNAGVDEDGRLALHYEVINGNLALVKTLISRGADIRKTDRFGKNVFHLLAEYEKSNLLDYLLQVATEKSCLDELLKSKDRFVGKDLLYVVRGKDRGRKAWHWVELRRLCVKGFKMTLHSGQIDVANYGKIMKSGFGPGPDEETQKKMKERQQELLSENDGQGIADMTPLHVAVMKNNDEIVKELLKQGAEPNAPDYKLATPMHYAAMTGNVNVLRMLEEKSGDVNMKTITNQTPSDVAEENINHLAANFINAKPTMEKAKDFISGPVENACKKLTGEKLDENRTQGRNLKRFVIDTLRDLTIDINQVLFDIGSGPILEASDGNSSETQH